MTEDAQCNVGASDELGSGNGGKTEDGHRLVGMGAGDGLEMDMGLG